MNTTRLQLLADQALNLTSVEADAIIDAGEDYDTPLQARFGVDFITFSLIVNALEPYIEQLEHENSMLKNTISKLLPDIIDNTHH